MKIIADTNIPFVHQCFSSVGDVELVPGRQITPDTVRDADILLVRSVTKVDSHLLAGSSISFVGTATIGFDHIDIDYLAEKKIGFASAPGSNANSVAEYIIAAILNIAEKYDVTLGGKSVGIIGVGNVGSAVEKKCAALGMTPYLNDPPLQRQTNDPKYLPIKKLFDCDFVTLHTPLAFEGIDKTFHLADETFFKSLKAGCVFLNTSRGAVNDAEALKSAIKFGKLKAAVLDVWENEPDIDTDLLDIVDIATPHIAGYSTDGKIAGMIMIYNAVCKYFDLKPEFDVNSFLPDPIVPQLKIDSSQADQQKALLDAVMKIYDIKQDDSKTRQLLNLPTGKKCSLFTQLRKEYPVRREFQNTQIVLQNSSAKLAEKLSGIGFKVTNE